MHIPKSVPIAVIYSNYLLLGPWKEYKLMWCLSACEESVYTMGPMHSITWQRFHLDLTHQ